MTHLFVEASKYFMIFLILIYTYECFHIFKFTDKVDKQNHIYATQRKLIFLIHFDAFLVLFLQNISSTPIFPIFSEKKREKQNPQKREN